MKKEKIKERNICIFSCISSYSIGSCLKKDESLCCLFSFFGFSLLDVKAFLHFTFSCGCWMSRLLFCWLPFFVPSVYSINFTKVCATNKTPSVHYINFTNHTSKIHLEHLVLIPKHPPNTIF